MAKRFLTKGEKLKIKSGIIKPKEVLRFLQNLSLEELQEIRDIGPAVGKSIYEWFRMARNARLLEKLDAAGIQIVLPHKAVGSEKLSGKTFVLTGILESMSREQAKERIRALGGETAESVSAHTDYVVTGEEPGSKYEKAKKLRVTTLDEKEFLKMLKR